MHGPVLVTGAGGFAGGYLLEQLSGRYEVIAWARTPPAPELTPLARWQRVDLLDRDRVRASIAECRPGAVFHLAGFSRVAESFADPARPFADNVLASHHLFDALRRSRIGCRVMVTGSAAIYASSDKPLEENSPIAPSSPYAVSKLAQEQLGLRALREDGIDVILTRPFNHTGPRQPASFMAPAVARQVAMIERGRIDSVLQIGDTSPVRDLSDVRDIVRAYEALMVSGTPGTVYNVASGVGRSVREILDALLARAAVPIRVEVDPARLRTTDIPVLVGDVTRLRQATGWRPIVPFDQTIDDLLAYWRTRETVNRES